MFSKPLAYPSALDRRAQLDRGCGSVVRRGGVLEPGALARIRRGTFLSQAGPRLFVGLLKLGIILLVSTVAGGKNNEGDPLGSPSFELVCGLWS